MLHQDGHVLIVDPGANARAIASVIEKDECVDGILLTHGHEDHTLAVDDLVDLYHCSVWMHPADLPLVDPKNTLGGYVTPVYTPIQPVTEEMKIGVYKIHMYSTPGHTEGSCCYQIRNMLFTGDTLFAGSCGRTDLYSGDERKMVESLRYLKGFPHDLIVYPGHGPSSTIKHEIQTNMFMQNL